MLLRFEKVTYDNLELAVQVQKQIFPEEDGRQNYVEGITHDPYRKEMVNYIVYDNGVPIGVVGMYSYHEYPKDAWLSWFGVLDSYRKKGYGTEIFLFFAQTAKEKGYQAIRVYTDFSFAPAILFYKKMGMIQERYSHVLESDAINAETIIFSKSLTSEPVCKWNNQFLQLTAQSEKEHSYRSFMFEKYCNQIKKLETFHKEDILCKDFQLFQQGNLEIYYAPHNEVINPMAKVFIVGITPGWTQTSIAYQTANQGLKENLSFSCIQENCKRASRFAGSMRNNLIAMLDELGLHQKLQIASCLELFANRDDLLHPTSVVPFPVFVHHKNYTGSCPKILESEVLSSYVRNYFYHEVACFEKVFIVPLGKAVEEILEAMIQEGLLEKEQCLLGFPHPSGANGHRKQQFLDNKESLKKIVDTYFDVYCRK